jgi:hypothetical protein
MVSFLPQLMMSMPATFLTETPMVPSYLPHPTPQFFQFVPSGEGETCYREL